MNNLYIFDNLKSGGGKTVGLNYFEKALIEESRAYFLIPDDEDYKELRNIFINKHLIKVIKKPKKQRISIKNILYYNSLTKQENISNIINFTNIPFVNFNTRQFLMIHKAQFVLPLNNKYTQYKFKKKIRIFFEKLAISTLLKFKFVDHIIVQTDFMKSNFYENISKRIPSVVIPSGFDGNMVSHDYFNPYKHHYTTNFFVPTSIAAHKNNMYTLHLAKELKNKGYSVKFHLTIHPNEEQRNYIEKNNIEEFLVFYENIDYKKIHNYYINSDAVFLPTLLESFCLPYVEGIVNEKYILTSDSPFSLEVCKDNGIYFNPYKIESGVHAIEKFLMMDSHRNNYKFGENDRIITWEQSYEKLMNEVINKSI